MGESGPYEVHALIAEGRRLYAAGERTRALQCSDRALGIDPTATEARDLIRRGQARRDSAISDDTDAHPSQSDFDPESTGPVVSEDLDWAEILGERGRSTTDEPPPLPAHFEGGEPLFVDMDATIAMPGRVDENAVWGVEEGHLAAHESSEFTALEIPDEDPLKMSIDAFAEPESNDSRHHDEPGWRFIDTSPAPPAEASVTDLTNPGIQTGSTVDVFDDTFSVIDEGDSIVKHYGDEFDLNDDPAELESVEAPPSATDSGLPAGLEALVRSGIAEIEDAEAGRIRSIPPGAAEPAIDVDASDPVALMAEAIRRRQADDFSGSLELVELVLELDPEHPDAHRYLEENTARLLSMYRSRLGSMDRVPRIKLRQQEIVWQSLDHREGFILSQVDGETSYDEIISISGMSELEGTRILSLLVERDVIG